MKKNESMSKQNKINVNEQIQLMKHLSKQQEHRHLKGGNTLSLNPQQ